MSWPLQKVQRFFRELKRRNVYKVAIAYLAVAFAGLQAAEILVPSTTLPAWSDDLLIYLAVFGFPLSVVMAWAFEVTPEGVRRTPERHREPARRSGRSEPSKPPDPGRRSGRSSPSGTGGAPEGRTRPAGRGEPPARGGGEDTIALETPASGTVDILPARLELLDGKRVLDRIQFHRPAGQETPEFTFGRAPGPRDTHVRLDSRTVSRHHARIRFDDEDVVIVNHSTTNPTRVNGRPLTGDGTSTPLADGDRIDMGDLRFRFRSW